MLKMIRDRLGFGTLPTGYVLETDGKYWGWYFNAARKGSITHRYKYGARFSCWRSHLQFCNAHQ